MRNNKLRAFVLFSLTVITFSVLFASCEVFSSHNVVNEPRDVSVSEMAFELDR